MNQLTNRILLTNDDGIKSQGLRYLAAAVESLGELTIVAPRDQVSGSGRSLPQSSDGIITQESITIGNRQIHAYAVGGSPAQMVLHAVREIATRPFDLLIAGVNFGENTGDCVTYSGTIGAALHAASFGIPAIAISLQMSFEEYHTQDQVDFSTAGYFARTFARLMLEKQMPDDIDVLKIEVPRHATPETPWRFVRQSKFRYFEAYPKREAGWDTPCRFRWEINLPPAETIKGTDLHALFYENIVAVTPLSLDLTSRVDLESLQEQAQKHLLPG